MTSFNLNYLLKAHLQIQPHWELGLQHEIWGRTVQSIAGPFLKTFWVTVSVYWIPIYRMVFRFPAFLSSGWGFSTVSQDSEQTWAEGQGERQD